MSELEEKLNEALGRIKAIELRDKRYTEQLEWYAETFNR